MSEHRGAGECESLNCVLRRTAASMTKEKATLSQAEKKRIAAEKQAAEAEERARKREAGKRTPQWLSNTREQLKTIAAKHEEDGEDALVKICRLHEQKIAALVSQIEIEAMQPAAVTPIQEMLEYLLTALDEDPDVDAHEAYGSLYDEIETAPSSSSVIPDISDSAPSSDPAITDEVKAALHALDFAETKEEIRKALVEYKPLEDENETVANALAEARRKLKRLKSEEAVAAAGGGLPTAEQSRPVEPSDSSHSAQQPAAAEQEHKPGRTVMNHSTHCDGLLPVLRRLEKAVEVKTCIPGKLHQGNANAEHFVLKLQRVEQALQGTIKLVARNGKTAQDVALVLKPGIILEVADIERLIENAVSPAKEESASSSSSYGDLPGEGRLNLSGAEVNAQTANANKEKHYKKHEKLVTAEKQREKEAIVKEKTKKLQSSAAAKEKGLSIKEHAGNWADLETGDRQAGKSFGGGRSKREGLRQ